MNIIEQKGKIEKCLKLLKQNGFILDDFTWTEQGLNYLKELGESLTITPYSYARKLAL